MQRSKAPQSRLKAALKNTARAAANASFRGARAAVHRFDGEHRLLRKASEKVATRLMALGEQVIAKSPIPVPGLVRDTMGKMQEALSQLGNGIDTINAGSGSLGGQGKGGKGTSHHTGKIKLDSAGRQPELPAEQGRQVGKKEHRARDTN